MMTRECGEIYTPTSLIEGAEGRSHLGAEAASSNSHNTSLDSVTTTKPISRLRLDYANVHDGSSAQHRRTVSTHDW